VSAALLLAALAASSAAAEAPGRAPAAVLLAIATIEADPSGPSARDAMGVVTRFAEESDAVIVVLDSAFFPWTARGKELKNGDMLQAAFIAGDMRPQLQTKRAQDHPAEGLRLMLKTYAALRKSGRIEAIPQLAEWEKLDDEGIRALVAKISPTAAPPPGCPVTEEQFLQQLAAMKDWPAIYSVWKSDVPACPDDGFYAEGYSRAVVSALAKRWADFGEGAKLIARDVKFRGFVYRHVDDAADEGDLRLLLENASAKCPAESADLCGKLAARARVALNEIVSDRAQ